MPREKQRGRTKTRRQGATARHTATCISEGSTAASATLPDSSSSSCPSLYTAAASRLDLCQSGKVERSTKGSVATHTARAQSQAVRSEDNEVAGPTSGIATCHRSQNITAPLIAASHQTRLWRDHFDLRDIDGPEPTDDQLKRFVNSGPSELSRMYVMDAGSPLKLRIPGTSPTTERPHGTFPIEATFTYELGDGTDAGGAAQSFAGGLRIDKDGMPRPSCWPGRDWEKASPSKNDSSTKTHSAAQNGHRIVYQLPSCADSEGRPQSRYSTSYRRLNGAGNESDLTEMSRGSAIRFCYDADRHQWLVQSHPSWIVGKHDSPDEGGHSHSNEALTHGAKTAASSQISEMGKELMSLAWLPSDESSNGSELSEEEGGYHTAAEQAVRENEDDVSADE